MKKVILTLSAIVLSGLVLRAADEPKKPAEGGKKAATPEERFKKADTNSDGFLSKEEYVAAFGKKDAAKAEAKYKELDKKGDGKVDLAAFQAGQGKKKDK